MLEISEIPPWLSALLTEKFFNACLIHEESKKNEKNVFCLDCCEGICPHCFVLHPSHRLLQIRRYVYHDVIRLGDADKLMDCAQVQAYTINSAKVVFLNQRPQTRPSRTSGNFCINCDRNLQDSYLFCSLSCKLKHILRTGCRLSLYVHKGEFLALPEPGLDDSQMTPVSVLEPVGSVRTESGLSSGGAPGLHECPAISSMAVREVVRKKRSDVVEIRSVYRSVCGPGLEFLNSEGIMNRRKGTPHRSPLY